MRVAVAGSGGLALKLISSLLPSRHEVVVFVQNGRKVRGAKRVVAPFVPAGLGTPFRLASRARGLRLPTIWLDRMDEEELVLLAAQSPDVLLVGGFGIILKRPILDVPRIGCVNVHSSLLPRHRGPNPFCAVILAGEEESGVTFHEIEEGIDTGNMLAQVSFPIGPRDTMFTVFRNACHAAGEHVVSVLDHIEEQGLQGTPQDESQATYEQKVTREDARIDWRRPAEEIERMTRAMTAPPFPWFPHGGGTVQVTKASCDGHEAGVTPGTVLSVGPPARVATGDGTVTLRHAFTSKPMPWIWPAPWNRPGEGESLEVKARVEGKQGEPRLP